MAGQSEPNEFMCSLITVSDSEYRTAGALSTWGVESKGLLLPQCSDEVPHLPMNVLVFRQD